MKIPLTKGFLAEVDLLDWYWLTSTDWWVNLGTTTPRAMGRWKGKQVYMHRLILNPPNGSDVDHINRNGLDNRRSNLRITTRRQNNANAVRKNHTSKFKGVSWNTERKCWVGSGSKDGKRLYLGRFPKEEDAARAYDKWAIGNYGEFARVNFP